MAYSRQPEEGEYKAHGNIVWQQELEYGYGYFAILPLNRDTDTGYGFLEVNFILSGSLRTFHLRSIVALYLINYFLW